MCENVVPEYIFIGLLVINTIIFILIQESFIDPVADELVKGKERMKKAQDLMKKYNK